MVSNLLILSLSFYYSFLLLSNLSIYTLMERKIGFDFVHILYIVSGLSVVLLTKSNSSTFMSSILVIICFCTFFILTYILGLLGLCHTSVISLSLFLYLSIYLSLFIQLDNEFCPFTSITIYYLAIFCLNYIHKVI